MRNQARENRREASRRWLGPAVLAARRSPAMVCGRRLRARRSDPMMAESLDASFEAVGPDSVYARRMASFASSRQRASRWLRGAVLLAGAGGLSMFGACRGIVAGDPINAVDELCSLLESCYPGQYACSGMVQELESAEPATQGSFLGSFDSSCLASCAQARACADLDPFCEVGECASDIDCCGWSRGELACANQRCCKPTGQLCETEDDCCTTDCVVSEAGDKTCGGVDCQVVDELCSENAQCCSNYCGPKGTCAQVNCADQGGECSSNEDCCDKQNDAGDRLFCAQDHCQYPNVVPCIESGSHCDGSLECCQTGDQCSNAQEPSGGVCGPPGCVKEGESCVPDDQCCGMSAICLPNERCGIPQCALQGAPCQENEDCCTLELYCDQGQCQKCDVESSLCHSVCVTGGPLHQHLSDPEGMTCFPAERPCIVLVGMMNRDCVCSAWGEECVDLALSLCADQICITPN